MALILFLIFITIAVLGRMFLQYRLTGNHGLRPAHKNSPPVQIAASVLLALSALVIFIYGVGQALGYLHTSFQPGYIQSLIGYFLYVSGLVLVLVSQHQMGSTWRIGVDPNEETKLIKTGLFMYIRNPIYTGLFIGGIGLLTVSPSWVLGAGLFIGYVAVELFVRKIEEPYLAKQFGHTYQAWYQTTPRYFPKLI